MSIYRVSPYVQTLALDDGSALVGHPFFLEYSVLESDALDIFNALRASPSTLEALRDALNADPGIIDQTIRFFRTRRFVLIDDEDEAHEIRKQVSISRRSQLTDRAIPGRSRIFRDYAALNLELLKSKLPVEDKRSVKIVLLGGCLSQLAANALEQLAPSYGLEATVEANWPDRLESMQFEEIDVVIFQPFTLWLIAPFWNGASFLTEAEREVRLAMMNSYLETSLNNVLPKMNGRLILIHGISTPTYSPFGAAEFRQRHSFRRVVHELNQTIVDSIRKNPNAAFIDEEALLSNLGKLQLVDDSFALPGHHGPIDSYLGSEPVGPSRQETFGLSEAHQAPRLFAKAYLDAFVRWSGIGRIKCVIVDLDNTLWPGVAGEEGFDLVINEDARSAIWIGIFGGIHQALKILKDQGVLLAIASRQNEADVDAAWEQIELYSRENGMRHLLSRDDFVVRKVNWERKSTNIAEILNSLGVAADAALFIDDNAAERAEVQAMFPNLRVLGENMYLVRSTLLSDPCLQKDLDTSESRSRTHMVKAQLERETIRKHAGDEQAFLRDLNVTLTITRVIDLDRIGLRLLELIQRTNQFNTTLVRFNWHEISDLVNLPQGDVYTLEVSDRFASYGLVGACLLWNDEIINFVLSCRIIPLSAAAPFLSSVLLHRGRIPIRGKVVEGPRNQPCRLIYKHAGFAELDTREFILNNFSDLRLVDRAIYTIKFNDDSLLKSA